MIDARDIVVTYGTTRVVDGVSVDVAAGEWVGLIGPNGAGKSSLLGAIVGAVPATGEIRVGESRLDRMTRRSIARAIAVVPQNPTMPPGMAVLDYVLLGRTPHLGYLAAESEHDLAVAEAALWDLGVIHLADRPLSSLSGGEWQRCVLARALAQESPVLLLDEPTSALDIGHRQQVLDLVADLQRTRGIAILAAMHDLTLAGQYADRLLFMRAGRIEVEGTPAEVLTDATIGLFAGARVSVIAGPDGEIVIVPRRRT